MPDVSKFIPIIGGALGLGGSIISSGAQSAAAEQQAAAMQANAANQKAINDVIIKIINEQLPIWQQYYKPLETQAAQTMFQQGRLPIAEITGKTIQDLLSPYQLPPQIRAMMLEQLRSGEQRALADATRQLTAQGIGGGQLAAVLSNIMEKSLPARFGIERDIALEGSQREEQRKLQAQNFVSSILAANLGAGQAGRIIPGGATATLGGLAGQYAQAASAASQYQRPQSNLFGNLGTTLAQLFKPRQTTSPYLPPYLPNPEYLYPTETGASTDSSQLFDLTGRFV